MAVRRSGIVGSALVTALVGIFLYRAGPTLEPASGTESSQPRAALSPITEPAKKSNSKSQSPAKNQNAGTEADGPWLASQKHFAGRKLSSAGSSRDCQKSRSLVKIPSPPEEIVGDDPRLWCVASNEHVRAMIAVVPDPIQTHLALRFDRAIDAIELAAESTGYVIDRYWLPWDIESKADWFDYDSFKEAKKDREQKETQPGLLMFRQEAQPIGANETVLYVFLVGETSTAGANGDQFIKAVKYADLLNDLKGAPGKRHRCTSNRRSRGSVVSTYVLGPTSSGSATSLAELMKNYLPAKFVINTTARNLAAIEAIRARLRRFSKFVRSVSEATDELCNMLEADDAINREACQKIGGHQVATLSETSTSLGASVTKADLGASVEKDPGVDIFRYPREIASLRNAYAASSAQSPATGNKPAGPRPSLSVNLADITNRSDEPPDFSKAQAPLSQESTLMAFAAEMKRQHYRYIGINASNTLDLVFLISFLRSAVPNARLFSFESDLLLEHEPDNIPYIGTLSVATYPLLDPQLNGIGEVKSSGQGTHLPFTSQREEALYNAAVCTVRGMLSENETLSMPILLSERKDCSEKSNPPLWLTVFGAGGPWPIEVLVPAKAPNVVPSPDLKDLPLPSSWKAVCTLLLTFAGLHIWLLLLPAPFSPKFRGFKLGTIVPAQQLFGIHTASATLALAMVLLGSSAWIPNNWTCFLKVLVWILLLTCWVLTLKYFCWWCADRAKVKNLLWWRANRTKARREPYLHTPPTPTGMGLRIAAFAVIWMAAYELACMWRTLLHDPHGHYGVFFSFRALNLASIVSPLTPMLPLLAGIYVGAIFYVWHLCFNDKIRPRLNPSGKKSSGENELRPGRRSETFIAKAVNGDILSVSIGGLIFGIWLVVFSQPQFELFERHQFQTLFEILFGLVILLILVSGFRLYFIWEKLRRFLLEINRQRARRVLLQLKGNGFSWASIWFYGSEDPDWDYMVQSLEVLQDLWNTPERPSGSEEIDAAIKHIRQMRKTLQDEGQFEKKNMRQFFRRIWITANDGKLEKAMSGAQDLFATTLNDVLDRLQAIWGLPRSTQEGIERQKLLEKYVALRWAAFIRGVIGRIRLLIIFLAIAFSLAMISLVVYSFEPHRELLWSVTALFVTIGLVIIKVLIQMHRDPTLSYITGTKPGRLDFMFYIHIVTLGVGPLVTLMATYFPSIGRYVLSFLQPGLEALK